MIIQHTLTKSSSLKHKLKRKMQLWRDAHTPLQLYKHYTKVQQGTFCILYIFNTHCNYYIIPQIKICPRFGFAWCLAPSTTNGQWPRHLLTKCPFPAKKAYLCNATLNCHMSTSTNKVFLRKLVKISAKKYTKQIHRSKNKLKCSLRIGSRMERCNR